MPLTPFCLTAHNPAGLLVQPNQELPAAQTRLVSLHRNLFFTQPVIYISTKNMLHKLHPVSQNTAAKNENSVASHAHKRAHKHHQASTRRLLNTGVSLCFGSDMLSSRSMHALRPRRSRVQPCRHTFTVAMPPTD